MGIEDRDLRVLALSKHGAQYRAVVARPNDAMWVFGGEDLETLGYLQSVRVWPDSHTSQEPSTKDVAAAVASFGKQRATD